MKEQIRPALSMWLVLTLLTGVVYPLAVTGLAQLIFPHQANGSLIVRDGKVIGSELIGQHFDGPKYFWSRPSATSPFPYNAAVSSGSNLGPTNPVLIEAVKIRVAGLRAADPGNEALYQVKRVARARGLEENQVNELVVRFTDSRQFGFLGEPRVNVLKLNLALDHGL
jgi:K+-transporting ATPase ATPase C chain